MIKYYLAILTAVVGMSLPDQTGYVAPEICDNGLDDDMDGLIDLNDTVDCKCLGLGDSLFIPASLIPNYSFEDTVCCPTWLQQLTCAEKWIQASRATSDYYHTCGYDRDRARGRPPRPLPSGEAYVGFLNTWWLDTIVWKEYIGACLDKPMELSKDYRLQFYLGFAIGGEIYNSTSPFTAVLYGTEDCDNLPFGDDTYTHCPANTQGWFEIARVTIRGRREWVRATMNFTVNRNISAVAIGPDCDDPPGSDYYFVDELVLNERVAFDQFGFDIQGESCDCLIRLWTSAVPNIDYQWYRNGIALIGATQPELLITNRDSGTFVLRASDGTDCQLSNEFIHFPVHHEIHIDTSICQGAQFNFLNRVFTNNSRDTFSLTNRFGCDSTVFLEVIVRDTSVHYIDTSVCQGQEVVVAGTTFIGAGSHRLVTSNAVGCDSFIYLTISLGDTFHINRDTVLCSGDGFEYQGEYIDSAGVYHFNLLSLGACDSLVTWRVRTAEDALVTRDSFICLGEPIQIGDTVVSSAGVYLRQYDNRWGCDSLVEWNVQEWENDTVRVDTAMCWGQAIVWNGQTFEMGGKYEFQFPGTENCDTIVVLTISEIPAFEITANRALDLDCHDDVLANYQIDLSPARQYTVTWEDGPSGTQRQDLEPGKYYYLVTDEHGCSRRDSLVITAPMPIELELEAVNPDCHDESSGSISIPNISGGNGPYDIRINGSETGTEINNLEAGNFEITIMDAKGCRYDTSVVLVNVDQGEMHLSDIIDTFVVGDPIVLQANINNIDTIVTTEWRGWNGLCNYCLTDTLYLSPGTYEITLKIIDGNGCEYFDVVQFVVVQQFWVPNAFTPNGDFINDFFNVFTDRSIEAIDELYIFDRWGEIVYKGKQISPGSGQGWDGTFNGEPMMPGVYVYLANFVDKVGNEFQVAGDVTLIR